MRGTVAKALRIKARNAKGELIFRFYERLKKSWYKVPKDKRHAVRMKILKDAGAV